MAIVADQTRRTRRTRRAVPIEQTVVYNGIKIAPITGKRSAAARSLRDALKLRSEQARGTPASA